LRVQRKAEQGREFANSIFGKLRIGWNQGGDGVEGVKEKVRVDAGFE
jgi:hypothetical protein